LLCTSAGTSLAEESRESAAAVAGRSLTRGLRRVSSAQPVVPEPDWERVLVSLYVVATTPGNEHMLVKDGAELHTKDQLAFFVRVGSPAYVQLLQVMPNGDVEFLYPESGEPTLLKPGIEYRVPSDPSANFELDERTGWERVVLVASRTPLAKADRQLHDLLRRAHETARWPAAKSPARKVQAADAVKTVRSHPAPAGATSAPVSDPHPGPTHASGATRGGRANSQTDHALELVPNRGGVALQTLSFRHLP
jgi:hypothetical protein